MKIDEMVGDVLEACFHASKSRPAPHVVPGGACLNKAPVSYCSDEQKLLPQLQNICQQMTII